MNISPKNKNGIRQVVEFSKGNDMYLPLCRTLQGIILPKPCSFRYDSLTIKYDSINNQTSKRFSNNAIIMITKIVFNIAMKEFIKYSSRLNSICSIPFATAASELDYN
jgi:hypothetical protein